MEALYPLLFLIGAFFLFSPIVFFIWLLSLQHKYSDLEKQFREFLLGNAQKPTSLPTSTATVSSTPTPAIIAVIDQEITSLAVPKPPASSVRSDSSSNWLTTDWPLKIGAFLLLIAAGWFVSYAFMNNWIGPAGRISFGLMVGAGLIAFAEWWQRRSSSQSTILFGLGAATVLVTIFAARELYQMFSPMSALVIVNIAAIAIAVSSLKNKLQSRAVVGLTTALAVPLLVATPTADYLGLLSYLTAVTIGYVWLIWLKGWRIALAALLAGILFYLVPIIGSGVIKHDPALNMLVLQFSIFFTLLLFSANLAVLMKRRASDTWNILIGALLGIFSVTWIYQLVPDYLQGLIAVAVSIVFMAGSFAVSKISHTKNAVIVYAAISVSLIGAAITFELSGSAMAISFILLATSVVVTSTLLDKNNAELRPIGLLFLVPGFLSVASMDQSLWTKHLPLSHFAVLSVMTISLLLVASIFRQWIFTTEKPSTLKWISNYDIAGLVYGMITIWLLDQSLFVDSTGNAISLIIFTILGLGFYIAGKIRQGKIMRTTGVVVLALVTARLLLVEVWNMPIAGRIITFALIGVLFMFTTLFERGIMRRWEKK